ncbi:hypothetical protein TVAG_439970 [Trichomonas vaginalis G3]|uniref:Uncharacterized protein n=1 Tax=Trichomonas vaginalis (strain ATCC PRA-98 / G3) TaxID=412133 RepID=A2GFB5_TRIV3|nr:hypothetical protein TVAGG3_1029810 [Trichomonas vaginalis G3]EAX84152.1 hypothetical protein TVAG_439970 [Trichomonas vaginalis G3]KAI5492771.1 hypothetical protein TVAGG3_1029810 [Trichomonas vaginalis G3]|eukprot:XP_001297082.1 hypothetical protein [Trichomonas vaginalis G3]
MKNIENSENFVHFEEIFKPVPKDKFIHFIVFTNLCEKFSRSHNISFDLISPSKIKKSVHIDGLAISQLNVEDIGLQIQALVQRLEFNNFALNAHTHILTPPLIEVTPQSVKRSSLRKGTSFTFNISLSKTTTNFTEFPIQIICEYDVPIGWNRCIHKIYVSSRLFRSSSDFYSILSSARPEYTAYNFLNQENLQKLFNLYNSKIVNSLPGENIIDPFFTLLPSMRWYIRFFLFGQKNRYHSAITSPNNLIAVHFPQISFWSDENTVSSEIVDSISFTEEIVGKPAIIVVDHDYKIEIYSNTTINPQSGVDNYIQEKIISRFPVPRLTISPMEKFGKFIIPEEKLAELVPNLFK